MDNKRAHLHNYLCINKGNIHLIKRKRKPKVQSRRAGNIGHKRQNENKQAANITKKTKKMANRDPIKTKKMANRDPNKTKKMANRDPNKTKKIANTYSNKNLLSVMKCFNCLSM